MVGKTVELFGWNEDHICIRARKQRFDDVLKALESKDKPALWRMASRYQPDSWFVRRLLTRIAPDFLPTPEEERNVFLKARLDDARILKRVLEKSTTPKSKVHSRWLEICWCLAVMWMAPSVGEPDQVATILREADLEEDIRPFFKTLQQLNTPPETREKQSSSIE